MAKTVGADQFANLACITVTESAANTLTFKKLETGISLFEKVAWIIHRVEYDFPMLATVFDTTADQITLGLATSEDWTSISYQNPAIIDIFTVVRADYGTAAVSYAWERPKVKDFTQLPSGGIIIPPNPLYVFAKGTGLASALTVIARMYYTTISLSPDQYWELVESRRIVSSS